MSKVTITITIDGESVTVSTGAATAAARPRSTVKNGPRTSDMSSLPDATHFRTGGDTSVMMPGKKDDAVPVRDAQSHNLTYWHNRLSQGLADDPYSKYAEDNRIKLHAIETEIKRRVSGEASTPFGGPSDATTPVGDAGADDDIPF